MKKINIKPKFLLIALPLLMLGASIFYNVKLFKDLYYPKYPKYDNSTRFIYDYTKESSDRATDVFIYDDFLPIHSFDIQSGILKITQLEGLCYTPFDYIKSNYPVFLNSYHNPTGCDDVAYNLVGWIRTSKDSMIRAIKYMLYRRVKEFNPYRLIIVNSLERKLKSGEAPYPDAISEKDLPVIFAKYTEIHYLVQKDYILSKLDSIVIKQAKKKKIPVVFDEY